MALPFTYPLEPMLAKIGDGIPEKGEWLFEPKWDGFRAIVFRDGDEVYTQSRDKKPLDRYFPELQAPLREMLPERCVLDGEIILMGDGALDFGALQQRIHPAKSRIERLSKETPAAFVFFDLLALGDEDLRNEGQLARRRRLEEILKAAAPPVFITPATTDRKVAKHWFDHFEGAGLEGLIAKRVDQTYAPKKRALMKIKHVRTVDCVVAGFRWHKKGPGTLVGSLLLGLYDDEGKLHHVGITSSFKMDYRKELAAELEPLRKGALDNHPWAAWAQYESEAREKGGRMPGGLSRWSQGKDLSWEPLRLERVVEVKYDYLQSGRFRHAATFLRWRTDKPIRECTLGQHQDPEPANLQSVFETAER
ncbi:MAG: ATP-dependent DNA ligase [Myxococcota bacterium]